VHQLQLPEELDERGRISPALEAELSADQWASSTATALGIAMGMLTLFITGVIAPGKTIDRLMSANEDLRETLGKLTAAFDRRNDIDEDRLRREQQHDERRDTRRPRG
jgi:hypothetical protein